MSKDTTALYERLVETLEGIERKGASMPYTSLNGNMFTFLDETGLIAIRLGAAEREEFIGKYDTALVEKHGRVMKEYVAVPDSALSFRTLKPWFAKSLVYARSLKPKPTKRPGKKATAKKGAKKSPTKKSTKGKSPKRK